MKTCIIKQPAGLGDILFLQKAANKIKQQGYYVVWPVIPQFMWLKDYIKEYEFVDLNSNFLLKNHYYNDRLYTQCGDDIIISFQDADRSFPNESVMTAKYKAFSLDFSNWQDYICYKKNEKKEEQLYTLFKNKTDLFINNTYGSPPNITECFHMKQIVKDNVDAIKMQLIDDITVFEWFFIAQQCKHVHTTDSCLIYLLETLKQNQQLYMYSRFNPSNFMHVNCIMKKQWNFIY